MVFATLVVLLVILLSSSVTEWSYKLSERDHLCLCDDRIVRLRSSAANEMNYSSVSCNKTCATETSKETSHFLRKRREVNKNGCPKRIPPLWLVSNTTVTFHDRENVSAGWYAQVSWSPFTDSSRNWSGYCLLYVDDVNANIQSTKEVFLSKNQTSVNITSSEDEKTIFVLVFALPLFPNVSPMPPLRELQRFSWRSTKQPVDRPTLYYFFQTTKRHPTTKDNDIAKYLSISFGSLVGMALVVGLLVYFKRPKRNGIPLPSDFRYHAFIIYNNEDRLWMKTKLLPLLEEKHHLTCCIHYRDFVVGKPFRDSMAESVYKSYKVIALFSSNFVKSNYCKYELDLAIGRLIEHRDHCLAVIRIDKVDCEMLPSELKDKSFIDYSDRFERQIWKQKLLDFLGTPEEPECHNTEGTGSNNNTSVTFDENRQGREFKRLESTTSIESDGHPENLHADVEQNSDFHGANDNRQRIGFNRLDSNISNNTVISFVSD